MTLGMGGGHVMRGFYRMKRTATLTAFALTGVLLFPDDAYAYLDPGTASMLLQGLIAGVAGGLAVVVLYWNKFKAFFFARSPDTQHSESAASGDNIDDNSRP